MVLATLSGASLTHSDVQRVYHLQANCIRITCKPDASDTMVVRRAWQKRQRCLTPSLFSAGAFLQADLRQFQLSESMTAEQRKQRNAQYKAALEAQIAEAEARQVLDDVFMVEHESKLNRRLISMARGTLNGMS